MKELWLVWHNSKINVGETLFRPLCNALYYGENFHAGSTNAMPTLGFYYPIIIERNFKRE